MLNDTTLRIILALLGFDHRPRPCLQGCEPDSSAKPSQFRLRPWPLLMLLMFGFSNSGICQVNLEQPPIDYFNAQPIDVIVRLQQKIDAGEIQLKFDKQRGYLDSMLEHLNVQASSQVLVYSKTSFQLKRISPTTPRAVYYADNIYLGWVKGGEVMEITAVDPNLGANFYSLAQRDAERPKFQRHTHECLQCHGSTMTHGVPGHMVRSVYAAPDGQPLLDRGSFLTDPTSPLKERWGGWYVTGTHGDQRHMGNLIVRNSDSRDALDLSRGANVTDLTDRFDASMYLSSKSDIVSLMVLEHQATMHNTLTQANFLARIALRDQKVLNEMLGRDENFRSETTVLRLKNAAEPVVKSLLFAGETQLTSEIRGDSKFAAEFSKQGPKDSKSRSLRDFDLKERMFRYPCSYLIYSESFDSLPADLKTLVYQRLWDVLNGQDQSQAFRHLTDGNRSEILEILRQTKPGLPEYWSHGSQPAS